MDLKVTSHVGRDLLASAGLFKTEQSVVWEYVVNSLQYVVRGVAPVVNVQVNNREHTITIMDNGRGMSATDLQHFFMMHGENLDRKAGRSGRGKFGTGKSAAFGIANVLEVETVHDGLLNKVRLTRRAIDASTGEDVPLEWLVQNEPTERRNGTVVTIREIQVSRINNTAIIEYIERNLAPFRHVNPEVAVNNHICEYFEPKAQDEYRFRPSAEQAAVIGDVELTIKVAAAPLAESDIGITISAGPGNRIAVERCGIERKEFGNRLFGEVDVPNLENPSPIAAYDSARNLQLNANNPVAATLIGFIGSKLEKVRQELVEEDRSRRQTAQARELAKESSKIAELLNADFRAQHQRLSNIRSVVAQPGGVSAQQESRTKGEGEEAWIRGTEVPGSLDGSEFPVDEFPEHGEPGGKVVPQPRPGARPAGNPDPEGLDPLSPAGQKSPRQSKGRGGFTVDYRHLGDDEDRSQYDRQSMTIIINLDHPLVAGALEKGKGNVEDPVFARISYEIAFTEYAIALGYETAAEDPSMEADDLLYDVRKSINRLSKASAAIYG